LKDAALIVHNICLCFFSVCIRRKYCNCVWWVWIWSATKRCDVYIVLPPQVL